MTNTFKNLLEELEQLLEYRFKNNDDKSRLELGKKKDYVLAKQRYEENRISTLIDKIQNATKNLSVNTVNENTDNRHTIKIFEMIKSKDSIINNITELKRLSSVFETKSEDSGSPIQVNINSIPSDVRTEVLADIKELDRCFQNECYRAAVILCGRIMEVCLHRKYYEATNIDLLEKNPGMGLGKLIAKMSEKGIKLDPGLTQQIHLINQVRIYSVHKKSESFYPSKAQTYAMILYTTDIIEKLF